MDIDRARAQAAHEGVQFTEPEQEYDDDMAMDDADMENYGSKTIIINVGSQNMRLGLATDALPKTVPMVIAKKASRSEAEDGEPRPKKIKLAREVSPEDWFGEDVSILRPCQCFECAAADRSIVRKRVQHHVTRVQNAA